MNSNSFADINIGEVAAMAITRINVDELTGISTALAAAIVRNRAEVDPSEAAKLFFECYDALRAENEARHPSAEDLSG